MYQYAHLLLIHMPVILLFVTGMMSCGKSKTEVEADPDSTETKWIAQQINKAPVALVFVHGFTGGAVETWTHANGTRFFDLVAVDPVTKDKVDILAFGYPSYLFKAGSFDPGEAANRLHSQLERYGVTQYPTIVFVAHSMGGLVVLNELQRHRELLPRVPLVVLFATPQEGVQIANVAQHLLNNAAAEQLTPADGNAHLRALSDNWNSIPIEDRPVIRCAYEKLKTGPIVIVPWSTATRFCEGSPTAIEANHSEIVKPDSSTHGSMDVLIGALQQHVLGGALEAKLETPDFVIEGDRHVFVVEKPERPRAARIVNSGRGKLIYTLAEFPSEELYVVPGQGPEELDVNSTVELSFVLGFGATKGEYRFVLRTSSAVDRQTTEDREVIVRYPELSRNQEFYLNATANLLSDLKNSLAQKGDRLRQPNMTEEKAIEEVLDSIYESLSEHAADLDPATRWIVAAESLSEGNWTDLSNGALQKAEEINPGVMNIPAAIELKNRNSRFEQAGHQPKEGRLWASAELTQDADQLVTVLKDIPALQFQGENLQKGLLAVRVDPAADSEAARRKLKFHAIEIKK
jgi:pimeloyl-ACP methyl ester carboxylesterase